MPDPLTIRLPWPPSVNAIWRTPRSGPLAGRTMVSREGRLYREEVYVQALTQRVPRGMFKDCRLSLRIIARPPDRRRRDLDNLLKAALDGLVHARLIPDDSHIDEIYVRRGEVLPPGVLVITMAELAEPRSLDLLREAVGA